MGAGQAERVAQEVDEQRARLDLGAGRLAVDGQIDLHVPPPRLAPARSAARRRARRVELPRPGGACNPRAHAGRDAACSPPPPARRPRRTPRRSAALPVSAASARARRARSLAPTRGQRDAGVGDAAAVQPQRGPGGGDRPVAGTPLDLLVGAAGTPARIDIRISISISSGPTAVSYGPRWNSPIETTRSPRGPRITMSCAQRRADRGNVLGRVGLAQRPADGAAIAHQRVGDHPLGVGHDREMLAEQRRREQVTVPRHRADPDLVAVLAGCSSGRSQVVDVDQVLRRGQPQLHHRQQAVPARDHPRFGAKLGRAARSPRPRCSPCGSRTVPVPAWLRFLLRGRWRHATPWSERRKLVISERLTGCAHRYDLRR